MSEEIKPLETVGDVLAWALNYLEIDAICNDECGCDASDPSCDEYGGCYLGKQYPCTNKHEFCTRCEFREEDEEGGTCFRPLQRIAPVKPQWSTDPPTEPGWYWLEIDYGYVAERPWTVCEIVGHGSLCVTGNFLQDDEMFPDYCDDLDAPLHEFVRRYECRWLKIGEPE